MTQAGRINGASVLRREGERERGLVKGQPCSWREWGRGAAVEDDVRESKGRGWVQIM